MKQPIIYFFCISLLMGGCTKKTDDLFEQPADVRIQKVLNDYQSALVSDPGWKLYVYPAGLASQGVEVGGLTYYMKFSSDNRVSMVSDFQLPMAQTPAESSYRLKAAQRPSLIFDTYSYIHVAADPDPNVSFSPASQAGFGWGTDFDFGFLKTTPADTIEMTGNYNHSPAKLIKVGAEEIDAAFNGGMAEIIQDVQDYNANNLLLYFNGSDNGKVSVSFNLYLYIVNFSLLDASGELNTISAPFSHTTYGLHLKDTVTAGGYSFQDLYWDAARQVLYIQAGNTRVDILNSDVPIIPFSKVIGKSITTISVPVTPLDGQSDLFDTVYEQIKTNLINSRFQLDLGRMDFIFDDASKRMALQMEVIQDGNTFIASYVYSYTISGAGIARFTRIQTNGNANAINTEMRPFLQYLEGDSFKLDYYTAVSPVLGQFTSQEHPLFFFSGNLQ